MHSDPESPERPAPSALAEPTAPSSGGAGLFDHSARDALSPSAGMMAGLGAIVLTVGITVVLVTMNPAFASGKAGGTANQLGRPGAAAALEPGTPAFEGARIIAAQPCGGCHLIPGIPAANGTLGPSLAGIASRTRIAAGAVAISSPDDLKKWIADPAALKPGTAMPKLPLADDELTRIVAFLETLK